MTSIRSNKGLVLILVVALGVIFYIGLMGVMYFLRTNIRSAEIFQERSKAYYLCEAAAAVAIVDMSKGRIGTGQGQWTQRTFNYNMSNRDYPVSYVVTKIAGAWQIIASVGPTAGFRRTYNLRIGGKRAFPLFFHGFPGPGI
jgi:hypothetical protein